MAIEVKLQVFEGPLDLLLQLVQKNKLNIYDIPIAELLQQYMDTIHMMQAVAWGKTSFLLAVIRQLCLNIPLLFLLDHLFGMIGIVWTQTVADAINVCISYIIFFTLIRRGKL